MSLLKLRFSVAPALYFTRTHATSPDDSACPQTLELEPNVIELYEQKFYYGSTKVRGSSPPLDSSHLPACLTSFIRATFILSTPLHGEARTPAGAAPALTEL